VKKSHASFFGVYLFFEMCPPQKKISPGPERLKDSSGNETVAGILVRG